MTKEQVLLALRAFARQRPGLEFGNYGDVKAYRAELRAITRDLHDAETLLNACAWRSISAEQLVEASNRAFSGRLEIIPPGQHAKFSSHTSNQVMVDYTSGQYFPTEYRKAVAAVCAQALWNYQRESAGSVTGDTIRAWARKEFGRGIASRWFV